MTVTERYSVAEVNGVGTIYRLFAELNPADGTWHYGVTVASGPVCRPAFDDRRFTFAAGMDAIRDAVIAEVDDETER